MKIHYVEGTLKKGIARWKKRAAVITLELLFALFALTAGIGVAWVIFEVVNAPSRVERLEDMQEAILKRLDEQARFNDKVRDAIRKGDHKI